MSKLRQLREEENLTQKMLGDRLGVSCTTVGMWESYIACPRLTNIAKLQKIFGRENICKADFQKYVTC